MSTSFLMRLADLERTAQSRLRRDAKAARRARRKADGMRAKSLREWCEGTVPRPRYAD